MSEVPKDWFRPTPALAGRLTARGLPPPVLYTAVGIALLIGFAYMNAFTVYVGRSLSMLSSFLIGLAVAIAIICAARPLSRKDRDWCAILVDWYALKFDLIKIRAWEWWFKW